VISGIRGTLARGAKLGKGGGEGVFGRSGSVQVWVDLLDVRWFLRIRSRMHTLYQTRDVLFGI
jgi:hypothetical protein